MNYFGGNLSYLRKMKKLTQEEFSRELEVKQQTLSSYECGRREPGIEFINKVSRFFEVSIDDLLTNDLQPATSTLSCNIRYLRIKENYTQEEMANLMGVKSPAISKYESGKIIPTIDGLISLSEIFGVTVDDLLKKDLTKEGKEETD